MAFDAFTAGIEPGGLRSKNEIRILICYLLDSVGAALSKADMINIMQDNALANYFEVADAIAEMSEKGILCSDSGRPDFYTLGSSGKIIAKQLDTALPPSVRQKAAGAAIRLLADAKRERENRVEFIKFDRGYHVVCHISGGDMDLMNITLYVPDLYQANMVKENFHRSPETVYRMLLALVTGRNDIAAGLIPPEEKNH
ncbi:hypothetical protein CAFE_36090 [Caprobacter fermentans]|uniref:DUF4364 family protein n=1 Tax=Caproicibacter fermentans TaxID=2576756 RepID=A0A6N8I5S3_9FIRM|nr:DUF4364 family protein [Caproicibacter fermentans]MVB12863.1 hypothetical protein [Caproicibacter fermentans]OCN02350.1 hypothetical protein A7X67_14575 [Clostridium sp. W14A]QNK41380.1 DUF4364 family protein [Caproicibacter fermentans]